MGTHPVLPEEKLNFFTKFSRKGSVEAVKGSRFHSLPPEPLQLVLCHGPEAEVYRANSCSLRTIILDAPKDVFTFMPYEALWTFSWMLFLTLYTTATLDQVLTHALSEQVFFYVFRCSVLKVLSMLSPLMTFEEFCGYHCLINVLKLKLNKTFYLILF